MKLEFSRKTFEKMIKAFHENPSTDSRVLPYRETEDRTDGRTDMTKPTVTFRNSA
jgi:hypothetical protein